MQRASPLITKVRLFHSALCHSPVLQPAPTSGALAQCWVRGSQRMEVQVQRMRLEDQGVLIVSLGALLTRER